MLYTMKVYGGDYPLLEKVNGELVEVVRTTDENGQIVLEGLPYGKYMFKELEAPRYYDLNENEYRFEVTTEKTRNNVNTRKYTYFSRYCSNCKR